MIKLIRSYMMIIVMGACVLASGATLMVVSQNVYNMQQSLKKMDREALMTEWEIRALNAELAFLTQPERLEQIATAMAQSITPSSGQEIFMISTASLNPYAPPRGLSIIPQRKPEHSVQTVSSSSTQKTPAPQQKQSPQPNDFSTLLNTIGGTP